jgi:HSP20 family protein
MAENQTQTRENQSPRAQESSQGKQVERASSSSGLSRSNFDAFFPTPREFFAANPFSLMRRMTEEMDRMFGNLDFTGGGQTRGMWSPVIEVAERDGQYVVHAELPGLKPEDVKVEVTNDALVIQGERKSQEQHNQGGIHRTERRYGQFYRTVPLPEGVNPEQIRANFQHGVLEVTVPVPQTQSKSRQIPIETSSAGSAQQTSEQGGTTESAQQASKGPASAQKSAESAVA